MNEGAVARAAGKIYNAIRRKMCFFAEQETTNIATQICEK